MSFFRSHGPNRALSRCVFALDLVKVGRNVASRQHWKGGIELTDSTVSSHHPEVIEDEIEIGRGHWQRRIHGVGSAGRSQSSGNRLLTAVVQPGTAGSASAMSPGR